ncbi:MAG: hypothetical protein V4616_00575 [Bacteroidota bacterium]
MKTTRYSTFTALSIACVLTLATKAQVSKDYGKLGIAFCYGTAPTRQYTSSGQVEKGYQYASQQQVREWAAENMVSGAFTTNPYKSTGAFVDYRLPAGISMSNWALRAGFFVLSRNSDLSRVSFSGGSGDTHSKSLSVHYHERSSYLQIGMQRNQFICGIPSGKLGFLITPGLAIASAVRSSVEVDGERTFFNSNAPAGDIYGESYTIQETGTVRKTTSAVLSLAIGSDLKLTSSLIGTVRYSVDHMVGIGNANAGFRSVTNTIQLGILRTL